MDDPAYKQAKEMRDKAIAATDKLFIAREALHYIVKSTTDADTKQSAQIALQKSQP